MRRGFPAPMMEQAMAQRNRNPPAVRTSPTGLDPHPPECRRQRQPLRGRAARPQRSTGCANSKASPPTCTPWPIGSRHAASTRRRWNRPACIGFSCVSCSTCGFTVLLINARHVKNVSGLKPPALPEGTYFPSRLLAVLFNAQWRALNQPSWLKKA